MNCTRHSEKAERFEKHYKKFNRCKCPWFLLPPPYQTGQQSHSKPHCLSHWQHVGGCTCPPGDLHEKPCTQVRKPGGHDVVQHIIMEVAHNGQLGSVC